MTTRKILGACLLAAALAALAPARPETDLPQAGFKIGVEVNMVNARHGPGADGTSSAACLRFLPAARGWATAEILFAQEGSRPYRHRARQQRKRPLRMGSDPVRDPALHRTAQTRGQVFPHLLQHRDPAQNGLGHRHRPPRPGPDLDLLQGKHEGVGCRVGRLQRRLPRRRGEEGHDHHERRDGQRKRRHL